MKLHQLFESSVYMPKPIGYGIPTANEIAQYIKQHCQPWLNEIKTLDNKIYRGVESRELAFIQKVRNNRRPRHYPEWNHNQIVSILNKLGAVANRDNSAFASKNRHATTLYGKPYIIFPVGKFNYTWLKGVNDFYTFDSLDERVLEKIIRIDEGLSEIVEEEIMIKSEYVLYVHEKNYDDVIEEFKKL